MKLWKRQMPNVEVSPNFRCPAGHCRSCVGSWGRTMLGSVHLLVVFHFAPCHELHFGCGFLTLAGTSASELLPNDAPGSVRSSSISKQWLGPIGHLRVSLSSSSRKFLKCANRACENPYFVQYPAYQLLRTLEI